MKQNSLWAKLVCVTLLLVFSSHAFSQAAYPSKPLKIVVPFGAGGVADLTARTVAQKLGENLGQSIVIENKPGAGGVVATDAVAKAAPDGYTLLLMSNATAVSAGLFKTLPYDAEKDLAFEILAPVLPQIKGQALRALAVNGDKRSVALPQVPTAREAGVKNLYAASWNALAVPSKTPRDIVQKLNQEIQNALNSAEVRKKLLDMNVDPQPGSLQQAADLLSNETKRWGEVMQRAGIPKL